MDEKTVSLLKTSEELRRRSAELIAIQRRRELDCQGLLELSLHLIAKANRLIKESDQVIRAEAD